MEAKLLHRQFACEVDLFSDELWKKLVMENSTVRMAIITENGVFNCRKPDCIKKLPCFSSSTTDRFAPIRVNALLDSSAVLDKSSYPLSK